MPSPRARENKRRKNEWRLGRERSRYNLVRFLKKLGIDPNADYYDSLDSTLYEAAVPYIRFKVLSAD